MKHKIYCFNNGGSPGWYSAIAIADDGHCLAGHVCSHESFMAHDLGITSDWKHDKYNKHFGEGNWELEWVADPKTHEGLAAAYELNQELSRQESMLEAKSDHDLNKAEEDSETCEHLEKDHSVCLLCGKDCFEDDVARAEMMRDSREDR